MNVALVGLVVSAVVLFGIVFVLYVRRWKAAGPRERALLKSTIMLYPMAGVAFGFLLWLAEQALPAHSVSPGVLLMLVFPIFIALPALLVSCRLTQIRNEEGTSGVR